MCLAVPAEVVRIADNVATCRLGEGQSLIRASLMLLPESPALGDYLMVHAGFALRVMDPAEAEETLRLLRGGECPIEGDEACAAPASASVAAPRKG
ncbi:MAG: HypC/HybG/HupF family hydrogenase formation chaperone [Desulfovibrio sp.]|nr:HypC/HybG/HupF family hydrogenase formation chaperone [Desulfovibrio sp.]